MEQETAEIPVSSDSPPEEALSDRIARISRELMAARDALLRQKWEMEQARSKMADWETGLNEIKSRTDDALDGLQAPPAAAEPTGYTLPCPESAPAPTTRAALETTPAPKRRFFSLWHAPAYLALLGAAFYLSPSDAARPAAPTTSLRAPSLPAPERFPAPPPPPLEEERGKEALGLVYSWSPQASGRPVLELLASFGGPAMGEPEIERLDRDNYRVTFPGDAAATDPGDGLAFEVNVPAGQVLPSPRTARLLALGK